MSMRLSSCEIPNGPESQSKSARRKDYVYTYSTLHAIYVGLVDSGRCHLLRLSMLSVWRRIAGHHHHFCQISPDALTYFSAVTEFTPCPTKRSAGKLHDIGGRASCSVLVWYLAMLISEYHWSMLRDDGKLKVHLALYIFSQRPSRRALNPRAASLPLSRIALECAFVGQSS